MRCRPTTVPALKVLVGCVEHVTIMNCVDGDTLACIWWRDAVTWTDGGGWSSLRAQRSVKAKYKQNQQVCCLLRLATWVTVHGNMRPYYMDILPIGREGEGEVSLSPTEYCTWRVYVRTPLQIKKRSKQTTVHQGCSGLPCWIEK